MSAAQKIIDKKTLQTLVPFNALSPVHFNEVAQKTVVEEVRAGRPVFKEGDRDNQSVYLLSGEISLVSGNEVVGAVTAGSDASRHPLAHQQPRQVSARAKTNVVVARVDSSLLDIMLTWDQSSGYEVSEIDENEDDDWMTRILQSQAFLKLPPSNIQRLLMRVESLPVKAGDVIIRQGGEGDFFYIIKHGRCMVTRKPSANAKEVKLAELSDGDAFGEDALVSDAKRNATITMITDGALMRLAKKDFVELLKEPLLDKLSYPDAAAKAARGAVWLDVRLPGEFENVHIPESRNIPLSALRLEANGLSTAERYIVCCDTGRRSASAAFVLSQRGFEVYVLNEGLAGVPAEKLTGAAAAAMPMEPGANATAAEVVALKPPVPPRAAETPAATDNQAITSLQDQVESLQGEKAQLQTLQARLNGRVSDLQDELERVRDEAREQILELEQLVAGARADAAAAQTALQEMRASIDAQRQAAESACEQTQFLDVQLTDWRAREDELQTELAAHKSRLEQLESERAELLRQQSDVDVERTRLAAELEALQAQAQQSDARLAQIKALEVALQEATAQTGQAQAEQVRRIGELEAALEIATTALERTHQEAERNLAERAAVHCEELKQAQIESAGQVAELQSQLDALGAIRSDLEARLAAAEGTQAELQQADQKAIAELQSKIDALNLELQQSAEQRAQADAAAQDLAALNRAQIETLSAEQDAFQAVQAESAQTLEVLQQRLADAQARIEALQSDAGEQVAQLGVELADARQQVAAGVSEREALLAEREQYARDHSELQNALEQAQARIRELDASAGEQVQRLEAALVQAQQQLQTLETERAQLESGRAGALQDLANAQAHMAELEASEQTHASAVSTLQRQFENTQRELEAAQATVTALHNDQAAATSALEEFESRLAGAEQAKLQLVADFQAEIETLHARLIESTEAQNRDRDEADQRVMAVEALLASVRADAERVAAERQQAFAELLQQRDAAEQALTEANAELQQLAAQQADAASSQDEQLQTLTQLREEMHILQVQLRESDAARAEIEARLSEMSAAAREAQVARDEAQAEHKQAVIEAEQRGRAATEQQLCEVRSELDGARAALARAQAERGNLEQARQAEYATVQASLESALVAAQTALEEREQALARSRSIQQDLETQLAEVRATADSQQQALGAELEQLRMATTADVEVMQRQLTQLKEELKAARKLSAGSPADDELERLRLLLDEAREEANTARANADQWRDEAMAEPVPLEAADEMAAMRVQLADIQSRVDEAIQLRDTAQEEVEQLRRELQARHQAAAMAPAGVQFVPDEDAVPSRGRLWLGLLAGLLLGVVGAGGALWLLQPIMDPAEGPLSAAEPKPSSTLAAPATNQSVAPRVAASHDRTALPDAPIPPVRRELRDSLGDGAQGPQLVEVPAARYAMGSGVSSLDADERPKHDVELQRVAIGKYEVSFDEYDLFARMTGRALPDDKGRGRGDRPVVNVSWEEAVAYTQWLSAQTGANYRLPTEAEWEYGAGGALRTLYWWGNTPGEGRANCFNCGSQWDAQLPAPVGSFPANPLGLHDTAGNVAEWVQDCYHADYNGAPRDGSAWVTVGCTRRVVRGGGFNSPANTLRTTKRDQQLSSMRVDDLGFRVVREF